MPDDHNRFQTDALPTDLGRTCPMQRHQGTGVRVVRCGSQLWKVLKRIDKSQIVKATLIITNYIQI